MIKVEYKNNEDGRSFIEFYSSIELLIIHMIKDLNENTGLDSQSDDTDPSGEVWTTRKDIKMDGLTFYSNKWGKHHTWTIKEG